MPLTIAAMPFGPAVVDQQPVERVDADVRPRRVVCRSRSSRSSSENRPVLSGLISTATVTRSNRPAARPMTSRWPSVGGSKEPGQTAWVMGRDRSRAGCRRTCWRGRASSGAGQAGSPDLRLAFDDQVGVRRRAARPACSRARTRQQVLAGQVVRRVGDHDVERAAAGGRRWPRRHRADVSRRDLHRQADAVAAAQGRDVGAQRGQRGPVAIRRTPPMTRPGRPIPGRAPRTRRTGRAPWRRRGRRWPYSELASAARTFSDGRPGGVAGRGDQPAPAPGAADDPRHRAQPRPGRVSLRRVAGIRPSRRRPPGRAPDRRPRPAGRRRWRSAAPRPARGAVIDASIFIASMVATVAPAGTSSPSATDRVTTPANGDATCSGLPGSARSATGHVDVHAAVPDLQRPQLAVQGGDDGAQAPLVGVAGRLQPEVQLDTGLQLDDVLGAAAQPVEVVGGRQHRQVAELLPGRGELLGRARGTAAGSGSAAGRAASSAASCSLSSPATGV